jgi:hypothetical protein
MLFQLVIFSSTFLISIQALIKCNERVQKLQLCSLHENYNKGVVSTGWENFKFPQTVSSSITLIDIAEFNENENTITLQMILSIKWYATTMILESNQDKYVFKQLYFKYVIQYNI